MRIAILAVLVILPIMLSGCAGPDTRECSFPLWVRVMPVHKADAECRRLGVKNDDKGNTIKERSWIAGCAPKDQIVVSGRPGNPGHELDHQIEKNCKK